MNTKHSSDYSRLALIAGPTASGKSAVALALAERFNGVIINADASQLYADIPILSAQPNAEDKARAPHRLYGVIDGALPCSAAQWADMAKAEIAKAHASGRLPILVGGTGLYLRTLIDGIAPVPEIPLEIRAEVRALPVDEAYARLCVADPLAASRLKPRDQTRIARALEVVLATGRTLGDWQQERIGGIDGAVRLSAHVLLPDREWLRARCADRFVAMLEHGVEAEVAHLLGRGLDPALPVMRAIGVREIAAFLAGQIDREAMVDATVNATRQYAKRQYTWFRHQPPQHWLRHKDNFQATISGYFETIFQ